MNLRAALSNTTAAAAALSLALAGCGGGGGSGNGVGGPAPTPTPTSTSVARLFSDPAQESLSVADVQRVIAQAVGEAQARNLPSTIAVVDRVGNVLAVFRMNGANDNLTTSRFISFLGTNNPRSGVGAQGVTVPASFGAIAKAITGAYLSSGGNAFSTRTASQIVQQHFPPAPITPGLESGPLFGVQFSSLPCSDFSSRFGAAGGAALVGPKRSPLGLAADAGGFPLYKNGVIVGGIGVMGDGDYAFDPNILDTDSDAEEFIALAGIQGFAPADNILADKISVDGTLLRFSDARTGGLAALQTNFAAINGAAGALVAVAGYNAATIVPGAVYGTEASGVRPATPAEFTNRDIFVFTDGAGNNRYPPRAATDAATVGTAPLSAADVRAVLEEAFAVMARGRAQIRQPLDSRIQVNISVVDTNGAILGMIRSPDAPIFGSDVSLQKARTAMLFSSRFAAGDLTAAGQGDYVQAARTFFNDAAALTGTIAFSDRAQGLIERPYYPDGEVGRPPGPLAERIEDFNPFATGLQVDLIIPNLLAQGPVGCTTAPATPGAPNRIANGIQIFPGAVPLYRNGVLVGAVGVSGDGIDQDDMISFLGANNGGARAGNGLGNAPKAIRADTVVPPGTNTRLRYVNCPFAPFLDTNQQNVCEGL
jgi:uncharacterized protein GlcG (DUF336 family)